MDSNTWWSYLAGVSLVQHCFLCACYFSDAAFLAREKARADAEYYTAAKFAEANMVKQNALAASNLLDFSPTWIGDTFKDFLHGNQSDVFVF